MAWISHGEVIEALVANRLTAPAPMVRVQEWAAAMAVDEAYGITPELLNDDRIARALDAVASHLDEITGSVGAAAITEFGVDVSRLHWDLTSISLYGAYPEVDEQYPVPGWGHPKDRRPDLKQIQTGLAVSGERRHPGVPSRLCRRGCGGGPGGGGDDRAAADRRAAAVPAGGRLETDLLHQRGGDGCPEGGVYRAAGRSPGPRRVIRRAPTGGGHASALHRRA